jgi:hypothetical protein
MHPAAEAPRANKLLTVVVILCMHMKGEDEDLPGDNRERERRGSYSL